MKETYAGTRRTEMQIHEPVQWRQKLSFKLNRSCNVHDATQSFFKFAHQYVVSGCHLSRPFYEPFCTTERSLVCSCGGGARIPPKLQCHPLPQFCCRTREHHMPHTEQRRQSTLDDTLVLQPPDESRLLRACAKCSLCALRGTARGDRELRRHVTSSTRRTPPRTYLLCSRRLWILLVLDKRGGASLLGRWVLVCHYWCSLLVADSSPRVHVNPMGAVEQHSGRTRRLRVCPSSWHPGTPRPGSGISLVLSVLCTSQSAPSPLGLPSLPILAR